MRTTTAFLSALLALTACHGQSRTGGDPSSERTPPLAPITLAQVQAMGADCAPAGGGPTFCTTTNPDCALTYDSTGQLTHLRCTTDTVVYDCTRPCAGDFSCTWSDMPGCADVYGADGTFRGNACGAALAALLQCEVLPTCSTLDEMSCQPPLCRADYCKDCTSATFVGCHDSSTAPPPCPTPVCMTMCDGLDENSCAASGSCHAVYEDDQSCACAPVGCCAHFSKCDPGAQADCDASNGGAMCTLAPPHCEGDYVVAIANGCYEGCVHKGECAQSMNVCPADGSFPRFDRSCMSDADCAVAIRQTDCCGTSSATGINRGQTDAFDLAVKECEPQWPACGCPDRGILADDGQYSLDPAGVSVMCTAAQCATFIR